MSSNKNSSKEHLKRFLQTTNIFKNTSKAQGNQKQETQKTSKIQPSVIQCSSFNDNDKLKTVKQKTLQKKNTTQTFFSNTNRSTKLLNFFNQHTQFNRNSQEKVYLLNCPKLQSYKRNVKLQVLPLQRSNLSIIDFRRTKQKTGFMNPVSQLERITKPLNEWKQIKSEYQTFRNQNSFISSFILQKIVKQNNSFGKGSKCQQKDKTFIMKSELESNKKQNQLDYQILSKQKRVQSKQKSYDKSQIDQLLKNYTKKKSEKANEQRIKTQMEMQKTMILNQAKKSPLIIENKQLLNVSCVEKYFSPIKSQQKQNQLSPKQVRQMFRIKPKRITERSIDHLEKIKQKLFKQKSTKNISLHKKRQKQNLQKQYYPRTNNQQIFEPKNNLEKIKKEKENQNIFQNLNLTLERTINTSFTVNQSKNNDQKSQNPFNKFKNRKLKTEVQSILERKISKNLNQQELFMKIKSSLKNANKNQKQVTEQKKNVAKPQITPTSSVISFGEQPTINNGEQISKQQKCQQFIGSW